jgi:hypothetical protein
VLDPVSNHEASVVGGLQRRALIIGRVYGRFVRNLVLCNNAGNHHSIQRHMLEQQRSARKSGAIRCGNKRRERSLGET